jgi:hypothetical protein
MLRIMLPLIVFDSRTVEATVDIGRPVYIDVHVSPVPVTVTVNRTGSRYSHAERKACG